MYPVCQVLNSISSIYSASDSISDLSVDMDDFNYSSAFVDYIYIALFNSFSLDNIHDVDAILNSFSLDNIIFIMLNQKLLLIIKQ